MRPKRERLGISTAFAMALVSGLLFFGVGQVTHEGTEQIDNWANAQAAFVNQGSRIASTAEAPRPPSILVLVEASSEGASLGLEISALAQHLGQALEGGPIAGEGALDAFNDVVCIAISWLLGEKIDPGGPEGMAATINFYLVASDLPRLDYPKAEKDLEKIYRALKRGLSADKVSRQVAEAIPC